MSKMTSCISEKSITDKIGHECSEEIRFLNYVLKYRTGVFTIDIIMPVTFSTHKMCHIKDKTALLV